MTNSFDNQQDKTLKRPERLVDDPAWTAEQQKRLPALASEILQPGALIADRFIIIDFIAEGGMGQVYTAKQLSTGRTVALKMLPESALAAEVRERFHREAKIASAFSHPNAVSIFDFGATAEGQLFIAMEYVQGTDLATLIKANNSLDILLLVEVGMQICDALTEAHSRGIVHRDLKPGNIMLTTNSSKREIVKVLDFGIAKLEDENQALTKTGELFGSPLYMSPEQCKGLRVTSSSDIYSLGCILYEALTGTPPHRGATSMATIFKHSNEEAAPPSKICAGLKIPPDLEILILKCLQKDPQARYSSCEEVGAALRNIKAKIASSKAILPEPASAGQRLENQTVSKKAMVSVAVAIAIVISGIVINEKAIKQRQEQQRLQEQEQRRQWHEKSIQTSAQADRAFRNKHYQQAEALYAPLYKQAVQLRDNDVIMQITMNYSIAMELNGHSRDAIEPLRRLVQLQSPHPDVPFTDSLHHLLNYLYEDKQNEEADQVAQRAYETDLSVQPNDDSVVQDLHELGNHQLIQKKLKEAGSTFLKADQWFRKPNHLATTAQIRAKGLILADEAQLETANHQYENSILLRDGAIEIFKKADPDFVSDQYAKNASDYRELGKTNQAKQAYKDAITWAEQRGQSEKVAPLKRALDAIPE